MNGTPAIVIIALALSAAATAQTTTPPQPSSADQAAGAEDPEIVVLAQRASQVRIRFKIDDKTRRFRCKVLRGSGDKEFDQAMCEPIRRCATVEPFNSETVRQCLQITRPVVLREYLEAHRKP
jgi:outer membrane biosynthesis protein TonB